ncbi:MAG: sigma-70 family RNA polymerase sigma factor [bacterium]|nr:sigma-70 family RNA polymerase sigma factor [bacterium]
MSEQALLTDAEIMQRIAARDQVALALLYDRYGTPVYSLALRILRQPVLAEEVAQDTFMKLWAQPHQWQAEKGTLKNWLLTIARYTAIDRLRIEIRHTNHHAPLEDELHMAEDDAEREVGVHERHLLKSLLAELPPEQSRLIQMGFYQGMTHRQLAEKLNLPLGTVKSRVRLGLIKLKALWRDATRENESR